MFLFPRGRRGGSLGFPIPQLMAGIDIRCMLEYLVNIDIEHVDGL